MEAVLEFEKPIAELESKIRELKRLSDGGGVNVVDEVARLEGKLEALMRQTYKDLTPWQKTQVARHQRRPHFGDYLAGLFTDYMPLAGDRNFGDDQAILGGLGRFRGEAVVVMGHEKGRDTETRVKHNFGMARPEGYRKAVRLMELADRFRLPLITLVDTPGAYPGVGAEERGQAEAIARSTEACLNLGVPVVSVIVGEGGSGGAVALAAGNRVLMFEHAIYSVISPEGCASILWRSADHAEEAATALKLTAQDLKRLKVIDDIVQEPLGGAHRDPAKAIERLGNAVAASLDLQSGKSPETLRDERRRKFLALGTAGVA
ncbi:acetyl-CoA carboxylase carboxyltransferase subunit alpha [Iodidimonas sp. SYSU 1G8]|uniref:acetyl-CoA carboxylase carboxyltransferase subunit alpha n=1 Tax=Iodidimonas sp. SYSU 1G8 TaxID=3133967 RepID=UPI0031FE7C97